MHKRDIFHLGIELICISYFGAVSIMHLALLFLAASCFTVMANPLYSQNTDPDGPGAATDNAPDQSYIDGIYDTSNLPLEDQTIVNNFNDDIASSGGIQVDTPPTEDTSLGDAGSTLQAVNILHCPRVFQPSCCNSYSSRCTHSTPACLLPPVPPFLFQRVANGHSSQYQQNTRIGAPRARWSIAVWPWR